jgi:alanine racemase
VTLSIEINSPRWRKHLSDVFAQASAQSVVLVPVIKGNGYGLGQDFLASVAQDLKVTCIAVGSVFEIDDMLRASTADVLVLEPYEPSDEIAAELWQAIETSPDNKRVIRVVASSNALDAVIENSQPVRFLLEVATDLNRFGFKIDELSKIWNTINSPSDQNTFEGLTFHFPLSSKDSDVDAIIQVIKQRAEDLSVTLPIGSIWISHLSASQIANIQEQFPDLHIHNRVGTKLWLGDRGALKTYGTVLNVTKIARGDVAGYRRKRVPGNGWIVTIAGGTSHGIALSAPTGPTTSRQRAVAFANGFLDAFLAVRSPFTHAGKRLMFLEPPHQHVSQLFVPAAMTPPVIGDRLEATVRYTTTRANVVIEIS